MPATSESSGTPAPPTIAVACLTPEEALSGAPEEERQRFKVPRILGDEQ
jgi:aspartyl-tRNA(Asn)/glutamyl-tRNA(Gln) amidotransferase subunit C